MKARTATLVATLHLSDLFTRMSSLSNAHDFLKEASELADDVDKFKDGIILDLSFCGLHGRRGLWNDAFRTMVRAEGKLKRLLEPGFVNGLEKGESIDWVDRFANLRISLGSPARVVSKSPKLSRRPAGRPSIVSKSSINGTTSDAADSVSRVEYESVTFSRMQLTIAENKGYSLAQQRRFEEAYQAMDNVSGHDRLSHEIVSAKITRAKMLLLEVHQLLGSDPLLCVLSESGISFRFTNSAISIPNVHGRQIKDDLAVTTKGKRTRQRSAKLSTATGNFQSLLVKAREAVESVFDHACAMCPSTLAQVVGVLVGETRLLYSIMSEPESDQNLLALKTIMLLGSIHIDVDIRPITERNVSTRTSCFGIRS
jgi:hypothetical protein